MAQKTLVSHPLPEPLVDLIAGRFRVLTEPVRVKLLDRLPVSIGACPGSLLLGRAYSPRSALYAVEETESR